METSLIQKIKNLGAKKIIALVILACLDLFVISLPYYIKSAIPNFYKYMHVDESVLLSCSAIIGWVTIITQLPGGWLADKFSNKKLLMIGVALTFFMSVWFAFLIIFGHQMQDNIWLQYQYYIIFFIWGISTTPFFWSPLWRLVSQQTTKEEQGLAFAVQGSFVGIVGFVFTGIVAFIVITLIEGKSVEQSSLYVGLYMLLFSVCLLILFFGLVFYVKEYKKEQEDKESFKKILRLLSNWKVWMLSIFLLGMYSFQSTFTYYLNQLLSNTIREALGIPVAILTILFAIRVYFLRLFVGGLLMKIGDKFKSFILLLVIVASLGLILTLIFVFMPGFFNNSYVNYSRGLLWFMFITMNVLFMIIITCSWIMVTLRFAQQAEITTPKNSYGSMTAILSLIGFSSDAWMSQIGSSITSVYKVQVTEALHNAGRFTDFNVGDYATDPIAYQIIIIVGCVVALIGIIAGLTVYISETKFNKKYNIKFYRWRDVQN